jgi:hypothetical protein
MSLHSLLPVNMALTSVFFVAPLAHSTQTLSYSAPLTQPSGMESGMESMYTFQTAAEPAQATQTSSLEPGSFTDAYVTQPFFYIPDGATTIPIDMTTNHGDSDMTTIPTNFDATSIPNNMTALLRKLHVLRIIYNLIQNRGTPPLTVRTPTITRERESCS